MPMFRNLDQATARGIELEMEKIWAGNTRLRTSYNWRRHVQLRGVLSISEEDSGLPNTVITMGLDNDRLVFNVQIDIARQAGLAISARLLQPARVVQ